jgi:hypothetical protein
MYVLGTDERIVKILHLSLAAKQRVDLNNTYGCLFVFVKVYSGWQCKSKLHKIDV